MRPRISILLPTCDRPEWLLRALRSIRQQSFADYEVVIYDNGTERVDLLPDERIRYTNGPADTPAEAFARALDLAAGDIVTPLADDDRLTPWALDTAYAELGEHEWLVGLTSVEDLDGNPDRILGGPVDIDRLTKGMYLGGAVYWRRSLTDRLGGFDASYDGAADYELYQRFAAAAPAKFVDRILYRYTDHPKTDSRVRAAEQLAQVQRVRAR